MIRARVRTIGGGDLGTLPMATELTWYTRQGQGGALTIKHAEHAPGYEALANGGVPVEITIELATADNEWNEHRDARFIVDGDQWERLEDDANVHSMDCRPLVRELEHALVDTQGLNAAGQREFTAAKPSQIIATLVQEAQSRGCVPWMTVSGDSGPTVVTRSWAPTDSIWSVLTSLAEAGAVDWWMEGRTLVLADPDAATDRTTGASPLYLRDVQVGASPEKVTFGGIVTDALVIGEKGKTWRRQVAGSTSLWGRREAAVSLGGVSDDATALQAADGLLAEGAQPKREYTREWDPHAIALVPGRDFHRGDWVLVDTVEGPRQRMRVADVSVSRDNEGRIKAFCTLGSVHDELLVQLARKQKRLDGATGIANGGRTSNVENRTPAAPTGVVAEPIQYLDFDGREAGAVRVAWAPVLVATTGSTLAPHPVEYRVRVRKAGGDWTVRPQTSATADVVDPVTPGVSYEVQVQAVLTEAGNWSAWSDSVGAMVQHDSTPPSTPSKPSASSALGMITVVWDKLSAGGTAMPADFHHCDVVVDDVTVGAVDDVVTRWSGNSWAPNTVHRVQLAAVDRSGNRSQLSATADVTVKSAVSDPDIAAALSETKEAAVRAQTTADGKGKVFYNDALTPPTSTSLHDLWMPADGSIMVPVAAGTDMWRHRYLDGSLSLAFASVGNAQIADLDAGKITTGTIDAGRIGAQSITADKLFVGSTENLIMDGGLTNANVTAAWETSGSVSIITNFDRHFLRLAGSSGTTSALSKKVPATAGENVYLEWRAWTETAGAGNTLRAVVKAFDGDGATIMYEFMGSPVSAPNGELLSATVTLPANTASVQFGFYASWSVTGAYRVGASMARRRASGQLVVDGGITALQIAANAITADKIDAGAVTAAKLAVGAVTADKIDAGAVTAEKIAAGALNFKSADGLTLNAGTITGSTITGGTVTGALVQTSAAVNRGVKLDSGGVKAYDAAGNKTIDMNGIGNTIVGEFRTDLPSRRSVIITNSTDLGFPGIWLTWDGTTAGSQPAIYLDGAARLNLRSWVSSPEIQLQGPALVNGGLRVGGRISNMAATSTVEVWKPQAVGIPTVSAAANLYADSWGNICRISSLSELKLDQQPITLDQARALLDVTPKTWIDRWEHDRNPATRQRWPGLIAENVADVSAAHAGALDALVTRDDDGHLTGVAYDRIAAYLIPLIRDIADRLNALEEKTA